MVIRTKKEDSAYVYRILESYEGLTNFSTLPESQGKPYRDILLHIPPDLRQEVLALVERLGAELCLERID